MDLTVDRLKIGSKLVFGKYGVNNDSPYPIVWLKASPNCDFITESVLDYLCFDAMEPAAESHMEQYNGNPRFALSNIFSFLNSDAEQWFSPSHPVDCPPGRRYIGANAEYETHYGFLYHFEEYETESLVRTRTELEGENIFSLIRLPQEDEIVGLNRFKLFSRKGVRPKGTDDMLNGRNRGFTFESYIPFWLTNRERDIYVKAISRNGGFDYISPCNPCGIRPVCNIKPDTVVVPCDNDMFVVRPYAVSQNICTDTEFLDFLGLARP